MDAESGWLPATFGHLDVKVFHNYFNFFPGLAMEITATGPEIMT